MSKGMRTEDEVRDSAKLVLGFDKTEDGLQIPYKTCECDTEEYVRRLFRNLDTYQKIMENQARWQRSGILHQETCVG